jgi:DNA-directed RNA polymerase subunit M/transcription elongation factor TFIIS
MDKEMCPESTQSIRDEMALRSKQKIDQRTSEQFTCPECGERKCVYTIVQLRGPDEPSSYKCRCMVCNQPFTVGG